MGDTFLGLIKFSTRFHKGLVRLILIYGSVIDVCLWLGQSWLNCGEGGVFNIISSVSIDMVVSLW